MSGGALIGDQIILEELYDETYTPTEQGRQEQDCEREHWASLRTWQDAWVHSE